MKGRGGVLSEHVQNNHGLTSVWSGGSCVGQLHCKNINVVLYSTLTYDALTHVLHYSHFRHFFQPPLTLFIFINFIIRSSSVGKSHSLPGYLFKHIFIIATLLSFCTQCSYDEWLLCVCVCVRVKPQQWTQISHFYRAELLVFLKKIQKK